MAKKRTINGFTLVELLATIFIISIVFSVATYYVLKAVDTSKNRSRDITLANIKKAASLYGNENQNDSLWKKKDDSYQNACVSFNELVNSGYLKRKQIEDISDYNYVILTRNNNGVIVKEEFDKDGFCDDIVTPVTIPLSKDYCNILSYNGSMQKLVKNPNGDFIFENDMGKDAGSYEVIAKLSNTNKVWKDGTKDNKKIICSIKKATPILRLNPNSSNSGTVNSIKNVKVFSNVDGILNVNSTNVEHVRALFDGSKTTSINSGSTITMAVTSLSNRDVTTYVDVTLTPYDTKNYYTNTQVYTIGNIGRLNAIVPTNRYCVKGLVYNGSEQTLVKEAGTGYKFTGRTAINAGIHDVVAQLEYGYQWQRSSDKFGDVVIQCEIKKAVPSFKIISVKANPDGDKNIFTGTNSKGTLMKTYSLTLTVQASVPGSIKSTTSDKNVGVTENGSINASNGTFDIVISGNEVTNGYVSVQATLSPSDTINYFTNTVNYSVKINPNEFKVTYNNMGGDGCSSFMVTYLKEYGKLCIPVKPGYTFEGWYADKGFKELITEKSINTRTNDHYLYAKWRINVCTIKYDANGGKFDKRNDNTTHTVNYGKSYSIVNPKNFFGASLTGYHFDSSGQWIGGNTLYSASTSHSAIELCPSLGTGDQTINLSVNWKINICTVNYDANNGVFKNNSSNSTHIVEYDNTYNVVGPIDYFSALRDGYHFEDNGQWTGGGTSYSSGDVVASNVLCKNLETGNRNITLKANWKINTCTIEYDANNGKFDPNKNIYQVFNYGTTTSIRTARSYSAKKTGYHFDSSGNNNWISSYGDTVSGKTSYSAISLCKNIKTGNDTVTLSTNWDVNTCVISYNSNGGSFSSELTTDTLTYENSSANIHSPSDYGASYSGWQYSNDSAWISSIGRSKYDLSKNYSVSDVCPNIGTSARTDVTFSVNWWQYLYLTCKTGNRCYSAGCEQENYCQSSYCGTHQESYTYYGTCSAAGYIYRGNADSDGKCLSKTWATCGRGTTCNNCTYTYSCQKTGYKNVNNWCYSLEGCDCSYYYQNSKLCGCNSWNTIWTTTSCDTSDSNSCKSKIQYKSTQ